MKELRGKSLLLIGFTLFSMFFGAGNLIFPPFLGAQAGGNTWWAMAGMALSAVGFPVLGVIAVARSGGLPHLAGRVGPRFSLVFTMLVYLSIGPCLAIPRTASTSFEMAVPPFLAGTGLAQWLPQLQLLYSVVFFGCALLLALRPEKLTDRLGKVLCPCLLALIAVVFAGCVLHPVGEYGAAQSNFVTHPVIQGFLDGYQTMDTMAALNFGAVIALNIQAKGIKDGGAVVRGTIRAGGVAGALLLIVYSMLAHVGALSGGVFPGGSNGAETLARLVAALFGPFGSVILAAIFLIACFNTCVGLISCCSEYFFRQFPRFSYGMWVVFFSVVSMLISNAGLNLILSVSIPVLGAIYPVAIVLIVLGLLHPWLKERRYAYSVPIAITGVFSILYAVESLGIPLLLLKKIPLASLGLGWVFPALVGIAVGLLLPKRSPA